MKKMMVVFLVILMLASVFTGCGSKTDTKSTEDSGAASTVTENETNNETDAAKEPVELNLVWLGQDQDKENLDKTLQMFTEKTGIKVKTTYIPGTWAEYFTKIQTMTAGGEVIDNAYIAIEGFRMSQDMGLVQPITAFAEKNKAAVDELFADVPEGIKAPFTMNGEVYGFPTSYNNVVMHFNTKRFEEAGVELPKEGWNKEEFLDLCKNLTKEVDGVKQYAVSIPEFYFTMEAWLRNNGASFMNADCTKSTINSPESIEIFQLWQDLVYEYEYAPIPEPNVNPIQSLIDGQVAMGSWGRWPMFFYESNGFKDVALQFLPSFKTNQVQFGVDGIFVTKSTKHYEEACQLGLWMASDEFVRSFFTIGNIPARGSLAAELVAVPGYPANSEIFYNKSDSAVPVSSPAAFANVASITEEAFSKIVRDKADVKSTLDEAAAQMDAILND